MLIHQWSVWIMICSIFSLAFATGKSENLLGNRDLSFGLTNWGVQALHGSILQDTSQPRHPQSIRFSILPTPLRTNVSYGYHRAEITSQRELFGNPEDGSENSDLWYSWQFMIPVMPDWKTYPGRLSTTNIIGQFHSYSEKTCTSPSICMELRGNNLSLSGKQLVNAPKCHWNVGFNDTSHTISPGVWYTIVLHIKWSNAPKQGYIVARYRAENSTTWKYYKDQGDTVIFRQTLGDLTTPKKQNYLKFGSYFTQGFIQWMTEANLSQWDIYYDQIRVAHSFNQLGIDP